MRAFFAGVAALALLVVVSEALTEQTFFSPAPIPVHLVPTNQTFNKNVQSLLKAFVNNGGLPRSYMDTLPTTNESYWTSDTYLRVGAIDAYGNKVKLDSIVAIQERTLTHTGLNLYDGATWQIALSLWQLFDLAEMYERNILYPGTTGYGQLASPSNGGSIERVYGVQQGLPNFRADTDDFKYGNKNITGSQLKTVPYPGNVTKFPFNADTGAIEDGVKEGPGALFYRMTGPHYWMKDPLDGFFANSWGNPWPQNDPETSWDKTGYIHWNDWKPITGENVWGCMIGPLQRLYLQTNGNFSAAECGTPENPQACTYQTWNATPAAVQLGISILPGLEALQSELGSLYHCPWGSKIYPEDPYEGDNVSNENNFSGYAALTMLHEILVNFTTGSADPWLQYGLETTASLLQGLESWFDNYLIPSGSNLPDGTLMIPQGGHVINTQYNPIPLTGFGGLAVDCQTWGLTVLGVERVDKQYGDGTAYKIWNATKALTGHYINGEIAGVGYTANATQSNNGIWSAEWTFGAITMCQRLAQDYQDSHPDWSTQLLADAASMYYYTQQPWPLGLQFNDGSYVYANTRFFIPWGWYANPISATCSTAWAVMKQQNFNPFQLGGGNLPVIPTHVPGTNRN